MKDLTLALRQPLKQWAFTAIAIVTVAFAIGAATFALVTILLGAIALAASYLPAMRATRADPMVVLNHNA